MMKNLNKKKDLILLVKESYKMYRKKDKEVEEAEEEEEIIKEAEGGRMKMKSQGISQEIIMIYKKNRLINLHGNINTKIL
jgi:hypothetical protein